MIRSDQSDSFLGSQLLRPESESQLLLGGGGTHSPRAVHNYVSDRRRKKVCRQSKPQVTERRIKKWPHEASSSQGTVIPQPLSGVHWPLNKVSLWLRWIGSSFSHVPSEELRVGPMDGADRSFGTCSPWQHPFCRKGSQVLERNH